MGEEEENEEEEEEEKRKGRRSSRGGGKELGRRTCREENSREKKIKQMCQAM